MTATMILVQNCLRVSRTFAAQLASWLGISMPSRYTSGGHRIVRPRRREGAGLGLLDEGLDLLALGH